MSGFAGIVRMGPTLETAEVDRAALARMAEAIAFRGPDGQQQFSRNGASFAFSLLTTGPAPQAAEQPVTLDGKTFLLGDVRLDRRSELIDALNSAGQTCSWNATDERIVLLAWKQWRETGVDRHLREELHGDFCFAIWEPARRELNCFRDVMGCRPFFYCASDDVFSFSNTLDAVQDGPGTSREYDREFIGDFLLMGWCPSPERTIYRKARRLPPGHRLTFSGDGLRVSRFQQLPIEEPLFFKREVEYVERYRDLLRRAVADRLPHGPSAIFLSGGMDSSSIAAMVCELQRSAGGERQLHAVTADMQPLFDDQEGQWARKVAEGLGLTFCLSHHGDRPVFDGFDHMGFKCPEPMSNPFRSVYLALYREASAKSRVAFFGYGGDDTACQSVAYLSYLIKKRRFRAAWSSFSSYVVSTGKLPPLRLGIRKACRRVLRIESDTSFPSWFAPSFERDFALRDRWLSMKEQSAPEHPVYPDGYRGLTNSSWAWTLDQEDIAYSGFPIQSRTPLLDFRLLRFLLRLPPLPWNVGKEVTRRAMKEMLPKAVVTRAKQPLAQDPLLLHAVTKRWPTAARLEQAESLTEFVRWDEVLKAQPRLSTASIWSVVPPIALNYWLKIIANRQDCLYSDLEKKQ